MIKNHLKEVVALTATTASIFFFPVIASLLFNVILFFRIRKDSDLMRAAIVPGMTLVLIFADNFVMGKQDYLRAIIWSFQAVALYMYYVKVRR